jgi:hypothetical protein
VQGNVLATTTATVAFAYRPSASVKCTEGRWYNSKDKTCYNGLPQSVTLSFAGSPVTLPEQVIWSVQYNTTHFGPAPIGESAACFTESGGCGYDSLNIGTYSFPTAPFVGTDLNEDEIYVQSTYLESTGWTGFRPLGAISAK